MGSLMSNLIKSCFVAVFILVFSGIPGKTLALDLTSAIFYTPIELKPIAYSHGVKLANVCALHDTNCTNKTIYIDSADYGVQCENEGYSLTSCDSGKKSSDPCPYDSTYFKQCVCDTSAYNKTDTSNCAGGNLTSCTDDSGTYYKCDCNTANTTLCSGETEYHPASAATCISSEGEIKYENSACLECSNNQVPNSTHTDCVCPSTWLNNCSNGCSNITGGDGTCWKDGYEYCQNCKACPNLGTFDTCPAGYICELEVCSEKYYPTGCAVNAEDITGCDWVKCFDTNGSDCSQDCTSLGYKVDKTSCSGAFIACPYNLTKAICL